MSNGKNSFFSDVLVMTKRSVVTILRNPLIFIPNLIISMFFLFVYEAGLSGISSLPAFEGANYLAFILPVSIVSAAIGWGLAFAGYSVGVALRAKNAQSAQAGTFIFFPLIFLSTTFVPYELIEAEWLKVAATINPTTYLFEAMRTILIDGWDDPWPIILGFIVIGVLCAITITFSAVSAAKAVSTD